MTGIARRREGIGVRICVRVSASTTAFPVEERNTRVGIRLCGIV